MKANLQGGFSILETIVSISIALILGVVSLNQISATSKIRLNSEVALFKDTLTSIILKSKHTESKFTVVIDGLSYKVTSSSDKVYITHHFSKSITSLTVPTPYKIVISPLGVIKPFSFKLTSGSYSCRISGSLRGRITSKCN